MDELYSNIINQLDDKIEDFIQEVAKTEKNLVIWGTNHYGQLVREKLAREENVGSIMYFGDNDSNKWNESVNGIMVKSADFFAEDSKSYFVIICSFWENEIANQLEQVGLEYTRNSWPVVYKELLQKHYAKYDAALQYGLDIENVWNVFNKAKILYSKSEIQKKFEQVRELLLDDYSRTIYDKRIDFLTKGDISLISDYFTTTLEYFSSCYYNEEHITEHEVFVDCGAYTGDTIATFIDATHGKYGKIYAYEPDQRYFDIAGKYIKDNNLNVCLVQKGVGECQGEGDILVTSLDQDIDDVVTWIKMDIEGYELSALKGARHLIQKYHPKLTICLYHKVQDIYEIPLYLHELVPEYRFKLSQHFRGHYDFILYADTYED